MANKDWSKILILGGVVLALVLIITGVFYFSFTRTSRDHLVSLVPADARVYAHLVYDPARQSDTQKKFFQYLFFDLGRYFGEDNFVEVLACAPKEVGLVLSKDSELAVILKIRNNCSGPKNFADDKSLVVNKNYLIISKSKNFLLQFGEVKNSSKNLASIYPWLLEKNNREIFSRVFSLASAISDLTSDPSKKQALNSFLVSQKINYFLAEVDNDFNFVIKSPSNLKLPSEFLVNDLPADTILSLVLPRPRENLAGLIEVAPAWFKKELFNFFSGPMQVIIFSFDQTKPINWQNPEYILVGADENFSAANIEALTKKILAYKIPRKQKMELPDKTSVNELIVDPTQFIFEKVVAGGGEIDYVSEPKAGFELAYGVKEGKFMTSNSIVALKDYFAGANNREIQTSCPFSSRIKLVLDPAFWLGLDKYGNIFYQLILADNLGCLR